MEDIEEILKQHYGTVQEPYSGPTYILRDGSMLNMRSCKHHSEVEKYLIDKGLSNKQYIGAGGSPTMRELGAIRCDTLKYYLELPERPITSEQANTLLIWLDYLAGQCRLVDVYADKGNTRVSYSFRDMISDDIVNNIKKYYVFGHLYEKLSNGDSKQTYWRMPFGCELQLKY